MDFNSLKVQMRVSVQLKRALNDTRRWIRVLSSETIGNLKSFISTNAPIFSLDKTLIRRLVAFKALWSCTETLIWSPLYGEKSCNVFIKNLNFFSSEEGKKWISWVTWGWVNYRQKFFLKWTNPSKIVNINVDSAAMSYFRPVYNSMCEKND